MGFIETQLAQQVRSVLMGDETKKIKMFTVSGQTLIPSFYQVLAARMSLFDSMTVEKKDSLNGSAEYSSDTTNMCLGFPSIGLDESQRKGIIIHEVTHAVSDMLKMIMKVADSEVMAYVAQCQFMLANSGDYGMTGETKGQTAIFAAAWTVARKTQNGITPSNADYSTARDAVCADNKYGKKIFVAISRF